MSDLENIELHDALLKETSINYVTKVATIVVEFYGDSNSRVRTKAAIKFEGVESFSKICNLNTLQKNSSAGNINYWVPAKGRGETYIYLVDGCIAVSSSGVTIEIQKI